MDFNFKNYESYSAVKTLQNMRLVIVIIFNLLRPADRGYVILQLPNLDLLPSLTGKLVIKAYFLYIIICDKNNL